MRTIEPPEERVATPISRRKRPVVLGIGGTLRAGSTSENALRVALGVAESAGVATELLTARDLDLPMYDPAAVSGRTGPAEGLLQAVLRADSVIVSTPGYHAGVSGLLKNALDYLQELASATPPYLHDRAVGCIVAASGWQAGVATLGSLRSTVHSLRGWPTPLGVVINSEARPFAPDGSVVDPKVAVQLDVLGRQVASFALTSRRVVTAS
jgi:FMN reductase